VDVDRENTIVLPEVLMTKLQISLSVHFTEHKNSNRNRKQDRMNCARIPPGIINSKEEDP